jgi:hypothetical protein
LTDALGNFRFDGLVDGMYILKCTFTNYRTETFTISLTGNETKILDIRLSPSTLSLDEITVTGSATPEQVMRTINRIDLELRPLKLSQDVLECGIKQKESRRSFVGPRRCRLKSGGVHCYAIV